MQIPGVCFVCGQQSLTEVTYCRPDERRKHQPYYACLSAQIPAAGAQPVSADGTVRLCNLCSSLLLEQWKCYEKRLVPQPLRQYWMKCFNPGDRIIISRNGSPQPSTTGSDNYGSPSPVVNSDAKCNSCNKVVQVEEPIHRVPAHIVNALNGNKETSPTSDVMLCKNCFSKNSDLQKRLSELAHSHLISLMVSQQARNAGTAENSRHQLFSLYENLMMQFHVNGTVDPNIVSHLQQLSAAEALASLQAAGPRLLHNEQNENSELCPSANTHSNLCPKVVKTEK